MNKNPLHSVLSLTAAFVLASVSVFAAVIAYSLNFSSEPGEPVRYDNTLVTPVLSARRIPKTLQASIAASEITEDVQDFTAAAPPTSCVVVERNGIPITPSVNESAPLVPASNQKLITTFVAFETLGADYQYDTRVLTDSFVDGVAEQLYLVGSGDPYLSTRAWAEQFEFSDGRTFTFIEDLADSLVAAGLRQVNGGVVGDESRYDAQRTGPWADRLVAQNQAGPLSALAVNEGFISWEGELQLGSRVRSTNPALSAAENLTQLLQDRGVNIVGAPSVGIAAESATPITGIKSAPLREIATYINSYSSNYGAELVLKEIGVGVQGVGSTAVGAQVVVETLQEFGLNLAGVEINDGSGLAEDNRLTCDLLVDILNLVGSESTLAQTLAVSGERGSLLERFDGATATGRVVAKTGTLRGSTALSGFIASETSNSDDITFAYIANEDAVGGRTIDITNDLVLDFSKYPEGPELELLSPLAASEVQE